MPSKHWIDWRKHHDKVSDLIVGTTSDGIGTPLLRIESVGEGVPENVAFPFIPDYAGGLPLAWVVREGRDYSIMTNCIHWVEYPYLIAYDANGDAITETRRKLEAVVYGPFKSLVSAINYVRANLVGISVRPRFMQPAQ